MLKMLVTLIPLFPLLACVLTATLGPRLLREKSHWPAIFGCALAFVCSFLALIAVNQPEFPQAGQTYQLYTWIGVPGVAGVPDVNIPITLRLDSLTTIMLTMVTFVATLVALYASGYMHGDRGYWRFFTAVSLFVFSMIMLVLSSNFLQLFMFWEAVGLCSYLLIGFWYEKPEAAAAGQKAFVVNRIGDFGFAAGIFLLWTTFGSLNYDDILGNPQLLADVFATNPGRINLICLCLFAGAIGKSAQFPLHVWLPDAMEGPTPVSALIHAATMVTAGVYMVTRCTPLFMYAPQAQLVVSIIGALTAFIAAVIALTQTDLKRVLAYSTVSQLGYMFLGLGTATMMGVAGGMFHLVTHAFFKALLFLGAGSVMHAMGGVIDMRRFSGLRRLMPTTYWTFVAGSLALAGLPPLSGFWSKDTILAAVRSAAHPGAHAADTHAAADALHHTAHEAAATGAHAAPHAASLFGIEAASWYQVLFWLAVLTAFMTAFYTFRAVFMTFHGEERIPEEAGHHAHESPKVMTLPLVILALGAIFLGGVFGHLTGWFDNYLNLTIVGLTAQHHDMDYLVAGVSLLVAVLGIGLAWVMYGTRSSLPGKIAGSVGPLTRLSQNKFYLDEIYGGIVLALQGIAQLCRFLDWMLVDGMFIGLFTRLPRDLARFARPLQNGLVQFYALTMTLAMAVLMWALLLGPRMY